MKNVDKYVRFMVDNGLIFEINRKVLHPLGLSIDIGIHPDNSKWITINGLLSVEDDDKEGFIYDEESFNVGSDRYKSYLDRSGQRRLDNRLESIGYIVQERHSSSLIDFHFNNGKDSSGRTIDECFAFSNQQKENVHDYIQWMFPNKKPSSINLDAPPLSDDDIKHFSSESHALKLYDFFESFLKSEYHDDIFGNSVNHNHLRITRVITFFREINRKDLADNIYNYCVSSSKSDLSLAMSYWEEALNEQ